MLGCRSLHETIKHPGACGRRGRSHRHSLGRWNSRIAAHETIGCRSALGRNPNAGVYQLDTEAWSEEIRCKNSPQCQVRDLLGAAARLRQCVTVHRFGQKAAPGGCTAVAFAGAR